MNNEYLYLLDNSLTQSVIALCPPGTGGAGRTFDVDRSSHVVTRGIVVTDEVVELVIILLNSYVCYVR